MDFTDRMNPFLVKELRQGLRSRLFVSLLLWIQASMCVLTALRLFAGEVVFFRGGLDAFYWVNIVVLLHILLPLRHAFAGDDDFAAGNYDLLRITPTPPDHIMWNKFKCVMRLMLICVASILPYQMLRYFFGHTDIIEELCMIGIVLINGAVFTLWGLVTSSCSGAWRIVLGLIMPITVAIGDSLSMGAVDAMFEGHFHPVSAALIVMAFIYFFVGGISIAIASSRYDFDVMYPPAYRL